MDSSNCDTLLQLSLSAILGLVDVISTAVVWQNKDNESYIEAAPGVIPHQFFYILPHKFSIYMQRYEDLLDYTFSIEEIDSIGQQNKSLCDVYCHKP